MLGISEIVYEGHFRMSMFRERECSVILDPELVDSTFCK